MTHVTLVGNCHGLGIAQVMAAIGRDVSATALIPTPDNRTRVLAGHYDELLGSSARVLLQPGGFQRLDGTGGGRYSPHDDDDPVAEIAAYVRARFPGARTGRFPKILFSAFHPDFDFVRDRAGVRFDGPCGHHSSLVFHAWQRGLSAAETAALFNDEVFGHLGYFDYWPVAAAYLGEEGRAADLPLDGLIARWTTRGLWMYSFNHPHLHVLADVARALLVREGLAFSDGSDQPCDDALARQTVFPVYPAIAARLGVEGGYHFQLARAADAPDVTPPVLDLPGFIDACIASYTGHAPEDLVCARLGSARYRDLDRLRPKRSRVATSARRHPYEGLPDHQFWRLAVEGVPPAEVNPVTGPTIPLSRHDRVATAGSCFAQHISRALAAAGCHFLVTETGAPLTPDAAEQRGFGVFSARYGNIYSGRQLVQLFDRAYGTFAPRDGAWRRPDGRFVDPFRPRVEPAGFASVAQLEADRNAHLAAVRTLFEELDVFVFTLGLTETWHSREDGAVYPLAPGIAGGAFDPARHAFANASVADVVGDLQRFVAQLRSVNARARVILTVSPVPLAATYEDRHVLVATAYSKAVLRVAADEVCRREPLCEYFPSFEIITGAHVADGYLADDRRSVTERGVAHVMRTFLRRVTGAASADELVAAVTGELQGARAVLCDEDAIGAAVAGVP